MSKIFPSKDDIIKRMIINTDETIHPNANIVCTQNDYWIAWHDGLAAVLSPNVDDNTPCDWVEGASSLEDLIIWVESGEYAEMENFDGSEEEWDELVLDSEAHHHEHDDHCQCHH